MFTLESILPGTSGSKTKVHERKEINSNLISTTLKNHPTIVSRNKLKGATESEHCILNVPYSDDREFLMNILKYGPDVEVLAPKLLRDKVLDNLQHVTRIYKKSTQKLKKIE